MYRSSIFAALVVFLALGASEAQAQVKPFKISGGGLVPDGLSLKPGTPAYHNAAGQATELGAYHGEGWFTLLAPVVSPTTEFSSAPDFVFTAANGDRLAVTYGDVDNGAEGPGIVTLYPLDDGSLMAVFVAEFNPIPSKCTGRFAKVTGGSFIMVAMSEPFFVVGEWTTSFRYSWKGEGTLTFARGK